jgi:hypothetical protein
MVNFDKSKTNRVSALRKFAIVAVLLSIAPISRSAPAQDHYYGSSTSSLESSFNWSWWQSMHFHANGSPRYASGFVSSTRNIQHRVPVNPPIWGPSYGYFQPCWKQMPVVRRCVACETFPANREIPNVNGSQSPAQVPQIPPAPEETDSKEKSEGTDTIDIKEPGNPEPDTPEPIPSP